MLNKLINVFHELLDARVRFVIWKGIDHLDIDLDGDRGDIDIIVHENDMIVFSKIVSQYAIIPIQTYFLYPRRFVGFDENTGKQIILDVDVGVRALIGKFAVVELGLGYDSFSICLQENSNIHLPVVVEAESRIVSALVRYLQSARDPEYLSIALENCNVVNLQLILHRLNIFDIWNNCKDFREFIHLAAMRLRSERKSISIRSMISWLCWASFRIMGRPAFYQNNGAMVAIVGPDGAGKSSLIDYINELQYFKFKGLVKCYFGVNNKSNGSALRLLDISQKYTCMRWFKYLIYIYLAIYRRLKMIPAYYYRMMGCVVIADRYFYDDEVYQYIKYENETGVKKYIRGAIINLLKMTYFSADLTIYLDVSVSKAAQRKLDLNLNVYEKINLGYKKYMQMHVDANVINADLSQCIVREEALRFISALLIRRC